MSRPAGRARSLVLYYHRVAAPARDPFLLSVSPENFARHVEVIADLAAPSTLVDIVDGRRDRGPGGRVAVTFDDGYADNHTNAAPALERAGVPATVFVASDVLSAGRELWWDQLDHLVLDGPPELDELRVTLHGRELTIDIRTDAGRHRALSAVRNQLFDRPPAAVTAGLQAVAAALRRDLPQACADHALLTADQLRELASRPGIEIGSHTVSHPMLSALTAAEQARELRESKHCLEHVVDRSITSFAYPYGERRSYERRTLGLVADSGYSLAVTTDHGPVGWWTSPKRVPRYRVEDWDADDFASALRSWLAVG